MVNSKIMIYVLLTALFMGSAFAASPVSIVDRSVSSATPLQGSNLVVTLNVNVVSPDSYYAIDDVYPAGWVVSDAGTGSTAEAGHIKWVVPTGATSTSYSYALSVPSSAIGSSPFSGTYGFSSTGVQPISGAQSVTVITAPVIINTPTDMTLEAASASGAVATYTAPTASNNLGPVPVVCAPASGSTFPITQTTVTCTATDSSNNAAHTTFKVTVQDTIAPAISNMPASSSFEATSHSGAAITYTMPTATDAVGVTSFGCTPTSGTVLALGPHTVTCTASDAAGHTTTSSFTATVTDTTPPVITLNGANPMTITMGSAYTEPGASVADIYYTGLSAAITGSVNTNAVGTYTIYYNAVDGSGNHAAEKTRTVNVIPVAVPPVITINDPNTSPAQSKTITASTNEGTFEMSTTTGSVCSSALTFTPYASITFTSELDNSKKVCYRATSSGVTYKMSNAIGGIDTTPPAITITGPGTIQGPSVSISASALGGTVTQMSVTTGTVCDGTLPFVTYAPLSFYSVSDNGKSVCYKAVDNVGNIAYKMSNAITSIVAVPTVTSISPAQGSTATTPYPQFTFKVTDTTYPVSCIAYVTVSSPSPSPFPITVNDASTVSMDIGTPLADGTHSWNVVCGFGSSSTNAFSVLNNDNVVPSVAISSPGTYSNSANPTFTWTATDSAATSLTCKLKVDGVQSGSALTAAPGIFTTSAVAPLSDGAHTIFVNCTDASHNSGTSTFTSTIDTIAPVASIAGAPASWTNVPADISVICTDANCPSPLASLNDPAMPAALRTALLAELSNNYKTATYASDPGTCPTTVAAYTGAPVFTASSHMWVCAYVKDRAGNEGFTSTPVEVKVDMIAPTIPSADITAEATSSAGATVSMPVATDDVAVTSFSCTPAGPAFALGNTPVSCTASDAAGNTATATFTVHVVDTTAPVIAAHDDITAEATSHAGASVTYNNPIATDAVDGTDSVSCSPLSGTTFVFGDTAVTCTASDAHSNTAVPVTFKVHVIDTTAPVITLNGDNPASVAAGTAYTDAGATVTDIYYIGLTATVSGTVNTNAVGTYTLTYTASDGSGNAAVPVTRTVNVVSTCQTGADTNYDGKIDMDELLAYIAKWKQGSVTMDDLLKAIGFWKAGTGC